MYSDGDFILEGDLMDPRSGRMYQLFRRFGRALGISNSSVLQGDGDDLLILRTLLEACLVHNVCSLLHFID